jgi:hypothetical protein
MAAQSFLVMNVQNPRIKFVLAVACALGGGLVGHFLFIWMARQGFYALLLPGALVGIGAGMVLKERSVALMVICGVMGLAFGTFSEWRLRPDITFGYFVRHLPDLLPLTKLMLALSAICGAYFARGRSPLQPPAARP